MELFFKNRCRGNIGARSKNIVNIERRSSLSFSCRVVGEKHFRVCERTEVVAWVGSLLLTGASVTSTVPGEGV